MESTEEGAEVSGADQAHDRVTYADLFAEREFRALFTSRALSTIGDHTARAALVITVFSDTGRSRRPTRRRSATGRPSPGC